MIFYWYYNNIVITIFFGQNYRVIKKWMAALVDNKANLRMNVIVIPWLLK